MKAKPIMKATYQKRNAYLVFGVVGFAFAVGYLALALRLPFGQLDRPGAGVFPVFVGIVMIVASLATVWEGWRMGEAANISSPVGADRKRLLLLIALLFGYFVALPWLGQIVTGAIFSIALMRMLSELSWVRIVVYAVVLSVAIDLVFARLLAVPLPHGVFGI